MANQYHLDILNQGTETWNQWRAEQKKQEELKIHEIEMKTGMRKRWPDLIDLSGVDLEGRDLRHINLSGANLAKTRLVNADFTEANLNRSILSGAICNLANFESADLSNTNLMQASMADANLWKTNLCKATLLWTSFFHAFLVEANLRETELTKTDFTWAVLHNANFAGAYINHTIFGDVDLSEVKGLDMLNNIRDPDRAPIIDIYTLARSSGHIPEKFLQFAGIPPAIVPSLLALFHTYHGTDEWWSENEEPSSPWNTTVHIKKVPRVSSDFRSWTQENDYMPSE